MKASRLSNPLERREQPEVVEFVPKQELDRARRQIERLQKENERLKQESERLRHERTAGQSAAGGAALPWRTQEQLQAARSQARR